MCIPDIHKINSPVLYLLAYASNKVEWKVEKMVLFRVSTIISVNRYSNSTYPYLFNVKRTFQDGGVSNPIAVGDFTDKAIAEKYRESLLNVASNVKFSIQDVEIKVKEQQQGTNMRHVTQTKTT